MSPKEGLAVVLAYTLAAAVTFARARFRKLKTKLKRGKRDLGFRHPRKKKKERKKKNFFSDSPRPTTSKVEKCAGGGRDEN